MYSKDHYEALIALSQGLATATHPKALRHLGELTRLLINDAKRLRLKSKFSPLARRILIKCAGQTLDSRAIAMACGKAPGGSTIKEAIRQLVNAKRIERIGAAGAARYTIPKKSEKINRHNSLQDK